MNAFSIFLFVLVLAVMAYFYFKPQKKKSGFLVPEIFPENWRTFLMQNVHFYASLNAEDKIQFEVDIAQFLKRIRITGIQTSINNQDRLLVASSAIIPTFAFKEWQYKSLHEVLLYPDLFTSDFDFTSEKRNISGMVGTGGAINNIVIFSKPSLRLGFDNTSDKKNVGIHEFVHLFDKQDGSIDGIPAVIMQNQAVLPWLELIRSNTQKILKGKSDINVYGATNKQEFLAVASEYFFERPKLLKQKHPEIYEALSNIFKNDLAQSFKVTKTTRTISRNQKCPCGSGKKFKNCCMRQD